MPEKELYEALMLILLLILSDDFIVRFLIRKE